MTAKEQRKKWGSCPDLDTVQGVRLALAWTARKMISGKMQPATARTFAYIAGVMFEAFKLEGVDPTKDADLRNALKIIGREMVSDSGESLEPPED